MKAMLRRWLCPDVARLRAALKDACDQCPKCVGNGYIYLAGGGMACDHCGPWRRVLRETK